MSGQVDQYHLSRLQLINWGVFDGYHSIPFSPNGSLITGSSGSGKSSLLDAISLAFLPDHRRNFNASGDATAAGSSSGKRTVGKYVRGAWGERRDGTNAHREIMYLRGTGPAWAAIAVTYTSSSGEAITGLVLKWLAAGKMTDAHSSYFIYDGDADIVEACNEWAANNYNSAKFRDRGWRGGPGEGKYLSTLYSLIGIRGSDAAQQLLGKAKSLKSVGGLAQFVREFMLDAPTSIVGIADALDQIEAKRGADAAQAAAQGWATQFPDVVTFPAGDNWVAIALGPMPRAEAETRLEQLKTERRVPGDSFLSAAEGRALTPLAGASAATPTPAEAVRASTPERSVLDGSVLAIGAGGRGAESGEEPRGVAREREEHADLKGDGDERVHVRRDAPIPCEVVRERDDDGDRREGEDPQSGPVAAAEDRDGGDHLDDADDEAQSDEDAGDDPGDDLGLGRCHLDADSGDIRPQAIPVASDRPSAAGRPNPSVIARAATAPAAVAKRVTSSARRSSAISTPTPSFSGEWSGRSPGHSAGPWANPPTTGVPVRICAIVLPLTRLPM